MLFYLCAESPWHHRLTEYGWGNGILLSNKCTKRDPNKKTKTNTETVTMTNTMTKTKTNTETVTKTNTMTKTKTNIPGCGS